MEAWNMPLLLFRVSMGLHHHHHLEVILPPAHYFCLFFFSVFYPIHPSPWNHPQLKLQNAKYLIKALTKQHFETVPQILNSAKQYKLCCFGKKKKGSFTFPKLPKTSFLWKKKTKQNKKTRKTMPHKPSSVALRGRKAFGSYIQYLLICWWHWRAAAHSPGSQLPASCEFSCGSTHWWL